jgi:hypothetical protein
MRASVWGIAIPIEPSLCGPFDGKVVPSPASSVMPHNSISGHPKRRSTSCILATGMVCPPTVQRLSEASANESNSGWTSMYMYMVGTPSNIVALCAAMLARISPASKRG